MRNDDMRQGIGIVLAALAALCGPAAWGMVKPHGLFTDGAVLQQGMRVPVWGTAAEGEKVTVSIEGQTVSTTATGGQWRVRLKPLRAGGPYTMKIAGENTVELHDLLVGEVYVCSGQSNMELPLAQTADAQAAIAGSTDPMLHLFTVRHRISDTPVRDVSGAWQTCGPETVKSFSAVAYFFGRDLRRARKVPVGLIESAWGGTPAEAWTSRATLESDSRLRGIRTAYARAAARYPFDQMAYEEARARYQEELAAAQQEGPRGPAPGAGRSAAENAPPPPPKAPARPYNPVNQNRPSGLYNGMILPLQPYAIRGAIWYQGESNAGRAYEYQTLFPAMIQNWRTDWAQGDFPFFFVQLAPFTKIVAEPQESDWAELREAQRLTALTLPRTAMAVITDVGEENDIHPRKKEPVGARLALAARAVAYGERVEYAGPTYQGMKVRSNQAIVQFRHVGAGLVARGGALTGFTLAGPDRKWFNAQAVIQGDRVIVSSPQVPHPVAVRYGWANYPVVNLYSQEGLPASPFRTDDFPLTTAVASRQ
jgi:sialate O-acetylesterase